MIREWGPSSMFIKGCHNDSKYLQISLTASKKIQIKHAQLIKII